MPRYDYEQFPSSIEEEGKPSHPRHEYRIMDDPPMNEASIIYAIETICAGRYTPWTIGITDDPIQQKNARGNPARWYQWWADAEGIARNVEQHFLGKGMSSDPGRSKVPNFVFIFR